MKNRLIRLGLPFLIWTVFYSCVYIYMEWPDFTRKNWGGGGTAIFAYQYRTDINDGTQLLNMLYV